MQTQLTRGERERLFRENARLAYWSAGRWRRRSELIRRLPADDIRQAALMALWEATARWEPARGPLAHVIHLWVRRRLQEAALGYLGAVRVPSSAFQQSSRHIGAATHAALKRAVCHDGGFGGDGPAEFLAELPAAGMTALEAAALEAAELLASPRLTARERRVLTLRYREGKTLRETGEAMGLSKERVRQAEAVALAVLRGERRGLAMRREKGGERKGARR